MKTIRVYRIPALAPPKMIDVEPTLAGLQAAIGGGDLECVTLTDDACMYLDEEGKLKDLAPNVLATFAVEHFSPGFALIDIICGDAIVVGSTPDGDETDVPTAIVAAIDEATQWRQAL